jgi:hypothetical protein
MDFNMPFQKGHKLAKGGRREGCGRTPDKIREICARSFTKRIPILRRIADDDTKDDNVRLKAVDMLAKYGLGTTGEKKVTVQTMDQAIERLRQLEIPEDLWPPMVLAYRKRITAKVIE